MSRASTSTSAGTRGYAVLSTWNPRSSRQPSTDVGGDPATEAVGALDDQPVDAGAVESPGGRESGETAADDDDVGLLGQCHGHLRVAGRCRTEALSLPSAPQPRPVGTQRTRAPEASGARGGKLPRLDSNQ